MNFKFENYIIWIATIIFGIGVVWSNIVQIPNIKQQQQQLEIRINVTETNYLNIKETLTRIERKLDGRR